ncbi:hypothetical protein M9H77_03616 [Catharanthus roseus]|uniref:Uncharacterized protein n=1 Tax=Catharanthus roseus TaxID=4058 RepID=A0ACC0CBN0_CATRO|nr:hypothetical protein M9H77_03616 [Catharanthus roseus]
MDPESVHRCARQEVHDRLGGLSVSLDLGVVAYTYIAASADDGDSGRPSCSSWRNMMVPDAVDTRLDLHRIQLRGNDNTSWVTKHAIHLDAWNQCDEYIRWYRGITRVHIGNPPNPDTRSHGYQPAGVDRRMMEVDDMALVAIREPPSFPSQMAAIMKKVQTIIRRCMVSIGGTLGYAPSQHDIQETFPVQPPRRRLREYVPDRGARGVKRGARRHLGRGAEGGRPPVPPAPQRQEHLNPGPTVVERGEGSGSGQPYVNPFDNPNLYMPFLVWV